MTKIPDCCIFPQPHELGKKVDLIQRKTFLIFLSLVNSKCLLNLKIAIFFSVLKLGLTMNLTYCLDVSENYCIAFWCFILLNLYFGLRTFCLCTVALDDFFY